MMLFLSFFPLQFTFGIFKKNPINALVVFVVNSCFQGYLILENFLLSPTELFFHYAKCLFDKLQYIFQFQYLSSNFSRENDSQQKVIDAR